MTETQDTCLTESDLFKMVISSNIHFSTNGMTSFFIIL